MKIHVIEYVIYLYIISIILSVPNFLYDLFNFYSVLFIKLVGKQVEYSSCLKYLFLHLRYHEASKEYENNNLEYDKQYEDRLCIYVIAI